MVMEDEKTVKTSKEEAVNVVKEKAKTVAAEETDSQKPAVVHKDRNIDLQLDLEKTDRDSGTASVSGNKLHHHVQKHPQPHPANSERSGNSTWFFPPFLKFFFGINWVSDFVGFFLVFP